jgi:lipopolysaccharide/colanic/teichoic acid biosynthesis glycosyltransferase
VIVLESGRPIFYSQVRIGLDGRRFNLLKFRTMRNDAERETGPTWTRKGDTRVTRIGRVLRRLSIDEMPQLVNILRGEMSIVGPRPERPEFVEQFLDYVPRYGDRHRLKTGLTGWAQVNGLRGEVPIVERTKYDLYYIENWSLHLDIRIIFKTIRAILFGKDAY